MHPRRFPRRRERHAPVRTPAQLSLERLEPRHLLFGTPLGQFVDAAYQDVLERPAEGGGLDFWSNLLGAGSISRVDVARSILNSPEQTRTTVENLYTDLLGRAADPGGLSFWSGAIQSGTSVLDVEAGFLGSNEYYAKHGGTDASFVAAAYQDILGRAAATTESGFWLDRLQNISRAAAAREIIYSPENLQQEVTGWYQTYLHRGPDPGGLAFWTGLLSGGTNPTSIQAGFVGSPEYFERESAPAVRTPGTVGETLETTIHWGGDTGFRNEVGVYVVDDDAGRVGGVAPGDPGYAAAVFASSTRQVIYSATNAPTNTSVNPPTLPGNTTLQLPAGKLLGLYLIPNAATTMALSLRAQDTAPLTFFSFAAANSDGFDHFRYFNYLSLGIEDLTAGGDKDFNDAVLRFEFPDEGTTPPANQPPRIAAIANQSIPEMAAFTLPVTATDPDGPASAIRYSLDAASAALGAAIDPVTGVLSWTPAEEQGPGAYSITVRASDQANPPGVAEQTFTINVTEVNRPPVLADVAPRVVDPGQTVSLNLVATDPDLPANTLAYSLDAATAPAGASLDPATGAFHWIPTPAQGGHTFTITARVSDQGGPALTDEVQFTIEVAECSFDTDLTAWSSFEDGGSEEGHGTTSIEEMAATLVEGDSFVVGIQRGIVIPATPSQLRFSLFDVDFDTSSSGEIRDAFEAALVDDQGRSVVLPFADGRDAFFNLTEGVPAALGPSVTFDGSTVVVDLSGVTVTSARLVFRLVNNDADTESTASITCVRIETLAVPLIAVALPVPTRVNTAAQTSANDPHAAAQTTVVGPALSPAVMPRSAPTSVSSQPAPQPAAPQPVVAAQVEAFTIDNRGTDFWLGFADNLLEGGRLATKTLFITGDVATTGTVSVPGLNFSEDFAVNPGEVTAVVLPTEVEVESVAEILDLGVHVVAQDEVTVYGLNRAQATTDAYLALPTDSLGTEYLNLTYGNGGFFLAFVAGTQLLLVGAQDDTQVTIAPGQYSIPTANSNVDWLGPAGNTIFNINNGTDSNLFVVDTPGDYQLNIEPPTVGYGGTYRFRLISLTANSTPIQLGQPVLGNMPSGQDTLVYRFAGAAGQQVFIDGQTPAFVPNSSIRLFSPSGLLVSQSGLEADSNLLTLSETGDYYVLVSTAVTAAVDFRFRVVDTSDAIPLTLGAVVADTIPADARRTDLFSFQGQIGQQIALDGQSPLRGVDVRLMTPAGTVIAFLNAADDGFPVILPGTSTYFVSVEGRVPGEAYRLQVLDLADAAPITLGAVVNAQLAHGKELAAFAFDGVAGQQLHFDSLNGFGADVRVYSPQGSQLFVTRTNIDSDVWTLPSTGRYTLYVQANAGAPGAVPFRLLDLADAEVYVAGATSSGVLGAMESKVYRTEVTAGAAFLYDGLDGDFDNVTARSVRPDGANFGGLINADGDGAIVTSPTDGTAFLFISNNLATPADYGFNVHEVSAAPLLPLDADVTVSLPTGKETAVYRLDTAVGDRLIYDGRAASTSVIARLIGPDGFALFQSNANADSGVTTIVQEDDHYLLVIGGADAAATAEFRVHTAANATSLPLGADTQATITPGNALVAYRFDAIAGEQIALDNLSVSGAGLGSWALIAPNNSVVALRNLETDFTANLTQTGQYVLTLQGNGVQPTVQSTFRATVTTPAPVTPSGFGTVQTLTIAAGQTASYQFNAPAGRVVYLDSLNATNQGLLVELRDPLGQFLSNALDTTDQGPITLPLAGAYSVVVSGASPSAAGSARFRVLDLSAAPVLAFDALTEGTLGPLEAAAFQFTATLRGEYVYNGVDADFDNVGVVVALPSGVRVVTNNSDADSRIVPINESGTGYVVIQNNLNSSPDFRFRLIDVGAAPTIALGDVVSGTFTTGAEAIQYQFEGMAGQRLIYNGLDTDFDNVSAQLLGPGGVQQFFQNADSQFGPFVLPQSGTYTLFLQANAAAGADYRFRMLDVSAPPAIAFGATVTGNVGASGREVHSYSFIGTAGQQIFYDALDANNDSITLSIRDPQNREIRISNAEFDSATLFLASTGAYTVHLYGATANAGYSFQLQDLAGGTPLVIGAETSGQTVSGRDIVFFTFDATAGQTFYLNGLDNDNDPTQVLVTDQHFRNLLVRNSSAEDGGFAITTVGRHYVFLVGRSNTPEDYRFRVFETGNAPLVAFGDDVSGVLPLGTDHVVYRFDAAAAERIYFDGLDNDNDSVNARIVGPSGTTLRFLNSDDNSGVFSLVETGTHYVVIEGNAAAGANYRFKLLDVDAAPLLNFDADITATLDPGRATHLYRIAGVPGNSISFDTLTTTGGLATWSLVDPANRNVISRDLNSDFTSTLLYGGDYVLVVSGNPAAPVNYTFRATSTTLPVSPLAGFGVDQTAQIGIRGSATFDFSAPVGTLAYLDVLQSDFRVPTHTITLDQGETYLLRDALGNNDLTGTVITADKPFAAFGTNLCAFVPNNTGQCDHLVEQLPPTSAWGREFVTVPLATRLRGDTFRFLAQDDDTEVRVNGVLVATLDRGQFHERVLTSASQVSANHPILVAQYSNGTIFDGVTSDPFMVYVPPFEQYLSSYTVTTPATGFDINYINVVAAADAVGQIELDGAPIAANLFSAIGTSGFFGAQVAVPLGSHSLAGPSPFGLFVYGFAAFDSYGYTGGQSLSPVASASSIELTVDQTNVPVGAEAVVRALVLDDNGQPLAGIRVDFAVAGANPQSAFAFTDEQGIATLRYVGAIEGLDTIDATVSNLIDSATIQWTGPTAAPTITIVTPDDGADIAAGSVVAVTGLAEADRPFASVILVTVNGQPVDVVDAAGNFFVRVAVLPGENFYEFVVTDSLDQTAQTTLLLHGVQRDADDVDFSILSNVSGSFAPQYARTSLKEDEDVLFADIAIRNEGQYPADAPLFVAITNLSDASVRVLDADGSTPDGAPYYDFTGLVTGGTLAPRGETGFLAASFLAPNRAQFTYDLVFFGKLNTAPEFATAPVVAGLANRSYRYEASATDGDGDTVTFSLPVAPEDMAIDPATGVINWLPGNDDLGMHEVIVLADDGRGGTTEQRFLVNVVVPPPNRPPVFTSLPLVSAEAGAPYAYDTDASDADGDALLFSLLEAPAGMTIDDATGLITWTPDEAQIGDHEVAIQVEDGAGGLAVQRYIVCVEPDTDTTTPPANHDPVITTTPGAQAVVGAVFAYIIAAQDADGDVLNFTLDAAPAGATLTPIAALPNRALLTWTPAAAGPGAFTILVDDGQGGQTSQQFVVNAVDSATNHDPVISSTPRATIPLGRVWTYLPAVSDEDNDRLTFALDAAPTGMSVDPVTGLLTWTPSNDQLGASQVTLRVSDGRGGEATQGFSIDVIAEEGNSAPTIVSVPPTSAVVAGSEFRYDARAVDPDNDPIEWRLVEAPAGVSIDAVSGRLRWTPRLDQLGVQSIVIEAVDPFQATAAQRIGLVVTCVNQPPAILSQPITSATADGRYIYGVRAIDPENAALGYSLETAPTGMTIDPATGVIRWTPTISQLGNAGVVVRVTDTSGASAEQSYSINVTLDVPDLAPIFRSRAVFRATAGAPYTYQAEAFDPEGTPVTYSLIAPPAGMTIDEDSGLISWTPSAAQAGPHIIVVAADDAAGNRGQQRYALLVRVNQAPEITSQPPLTISAGAVYQYDVQVDDPENDAITFALTGAPAGMTIDLLGRIIWTTAIADLGSHTVEVTATDPHGLSDAQSFTLTVAPDTIAPRVGITLSANPVAIGNAVVITVQALDDVGVESLALTVNGQAVTLTEQGTAIFTPEQPGLLNVVATAADTAGNTGQASELLRAFDPADTAGPTVEITSPAPDTVVTTLTNVIGSASDPNLEFYRVEFARADLVDANSPAAADPDWQLIAQSSTSVINGLLGTFDPTLLLNDDYLVRVLAQDTSGNVSARTVRLSLDGNLKFGEFALSFTDLSLAIAGIPITVTRNYDTRNAANEGDFGFGWTLGFGDAQIRETVPISDLERQGLFFGVNPFRFGTKVFLTAPDGSRLGFTFDPEPQFSLFGGGYYLPKFRPDPGVFAELEVDPAALRVIPGGTFASQFLGFPYNPSAYRLKTRDGATYHYDQFQGLQQVTDRNGNTLTFTDDGIESSTGDRVQFVRDSFGRIERIIDPDGNATRYEYDANGDLVRVINSEGEATTFEYNLGRPHLLTTEIDHEGREIVTAQYDGAGRLIEFTDGEGNGLQTSFNADTLTETIRDAEGNETVAVYDERGNLVESTDPAGETWRYTYDANGNMLTATNPRGFTTERAFDARGNLIEMMDGSGELYRTEYNAFNQITKLIDPLGRTATYEYDAFGNLVAMVNRAGVRSTQTVDAFGRITSLTDTLGRSTQFIYGDGQYPVEALYADGTRRRTEYNDSGLITREEDENGRSTHYNYDTLGRLVSIVDALGQRTVMEYDGDYLVSITDPLGVITRYERDDAFRIVRVVENAAPATGIVAQASGPQRVTQYEYNGNNQVTAEISPLGGRTEYVYDERGLLSTVTDPLGNVTRMEYDSAGNLTKITDGRNNAIEYVYDAMNRLIEQRDPIGGVQKYEYDALGNQTSYTDQLNRTSTFEYDALDRLVKAVDPLGGIRRKEYDSAGRNTKYVNENGAESRAEYDERGRVTRLIDALGFDVEYAYDDAGNRTSFTDEEGHTTSYTYDVLNRVVSTRNPMGGLTGYTYDALGRLLSVTDPLGRSETSVYNELGDLVSRTRADSRQEHNTFDAAGNVITMTDALGNTTTFTRDLLGRVTAETDPLGHTAFSKYDAVDNLIEYTDRNGDVRAYVYDALNRTTQEQWFTGGSLVRTIDYAFDLAGRWISASDPDSTYAFSYDPLGRLTSADNAGTPGVPHVVLDYTRDLVGNIVELTSSIGVNVASTYDARNMLTDRSWTGPGLEALVQFEYDGRRLLTGLERFSDAAGTQSAGRSALSYDADHRLTSLVHRSAADAVLSQYDYSYDLAGQMLSSDGGGDSADYEYDLLGQLISASHSSLPDESYGYDAAGNREGGSVVVTEGNRLASDDRFDYEYDDNGALILRTERATGIETHFDYDHRGRMTRIEQRDSGGATLHETTYRYDVLDRRIAQTVDGVTTYTVYDHQRAFADFAADGTLDAAYLYAPGADNILARSTDDGLAWYLADLQGTVRDIVDSAGQVLDHVDYDSFGQVLSESNPAQGDRFKFTGREYDALSEMYYYRARYYDPHQGRFISEDPLRFGGGDLNLSRYVENDPLGATDPFGLSPIVSYVLNVAGVLGGRFGLIKTLAEFGGKEPYTLTIKGNANGISLGASGGVTLNHGGNSIGFGIKNGNAYANGKFKIGPVTISGGVSAPLPTANGQFTFMFTATSKSPVFLARFAEAAFGLAAIELDLFARYIVAPDTETLVQTRIEQGTLTAEAYATKSPNDCEDPPSPWQFVQVGAPALTSSQLGGRGASGGVMQLTVHGDDRDPSPNVFPGMTIVDFHGDVNGNLAGGLTATDLAMAIMSAGAMGDTLYCNICHFGSSPDLPLLQQMTGGVIHAPTGEGATGEETFTIYHQGDIETVGW